MWLKINIQVLKSTQSELVLLDWFCKLLLEVSYYIIIENYLVKQPITLLTIETLILLYAIANGIDELESLINFWN